MTGKLIKYELRSILKNMGIVWIALVALAAFAGIFDMINQRQPYSRYAMAADLASSITNFLYISIFVALIAVTCVVILMRFYKGLLRDEGYLMHTLPVKTWQLITAKGVVAALTSLISILVAGLSTFVLSLFNGGARYIGEFIRDLLQAFGAYPEFIPVALEVVLLGIGALTANIYRVYAAMSIGQLGQKHRIALSVGAWIGINVILLVLMTLMGNVVFSSSVADWLEEAVDGIIQDSPVRAMHLGLWLFILLNAVQIAIFHVVSEQILRRKLNLE